MIIEDDETSLKLNETNLLSEAEIPRGTPDKATFTEKDEGYKRSGSFNFASRDRTGSVTSNPGGAQKAPAATLEDELLLAVQSLRDFDNLLELVQDFEEKAAELRKLMTSVEQDSQRLNVVPQMTKACFQMLTRSL